MDKIILFFKLFFKCYLQEEEKLLAVRVAAKSHFYAKLLKGWLEDSRFWKIHYLGPDSIIELIEFADTNPELMDILNLTVNLTFKFTNLYAHEDVILKFSERAYDNSGFIDLFDLYVTNYSFLRFSSQSLLPFPNLYSKKSREDNSETYLRLVKIYNYLAEKVSFSIEFLRGLIEDAKDNIESMKIVKAYILFHSIDKDLQYMIKNLSKNSPRMMNLLESLARQERLHYEVLLELMEDSKNNPKFMNILRICKNPCYAIIQKVVKDAEENESSLDILKSWAKDGYLCNDIQAKIANKVYDYSKFIGIFEICAENGTLCEQAKNILIVIAAKNSII